MLGYIYTHIVYRTVLEFENPEMTVTGAAAFFKAVWRFFAMFFGSSMIGMVSGLVSALVSFDEFVAHIV